MIRITDTEIREDVYRELRQTSPLDGAEIEVTVKDYIVTLKGTVSSTAASLYAVDAARRVEGVHEVINNLEAHPPADARTDAEVAEEVRQALESDGLISEKSIEYTVTNGWVGLGGSVACLCEREEAERAVRDLVGVRGVYNQIAVNA